MEIKTVVVGDCGTNCYLLSGEDFAVIIDPGYSDVRVRDFAKQNEQKPNKAILLTHCHFDHIGGVNEIKNIWQCPVIIGEQEKAGLENPNVNFSAFWGDEVWSIIADKGVTVKNTVNKGEIYANNSAGGIAGSLLNGILKALVKLLIFPNSDGIIIFISHVIIICNSLFLPLNTLFCIIFS